MAVCLKRQGTKVRQHVTVTNVRSISSDETKASWQIGKADNTQRSLGYKLMGGKKAVINEDLHVTLRRPW